MIFGVFLGKRKVKTTERVPVTKEGPEEVVANDPLERFFKLLDRSTEHEGGGAGRPSDKKNN